MNGNMNHDQERNEQVREGRMMAKKTLYLRGNSKNKPTLKGHEAFLKALEASGATIKVFLLDQEEPLVGTVKHSDKYTISLEPSDGGESEVVFKHAIRSFRAMTPRPTPETLQ